MKHWWWLCWSMNKPLRVAAEDSLPPRFEVLTAVVINIREIHREAEDNTFL
jgi:hypothetical protein